ncbi:YcxB family protein [Corallincola platygyrae]|uniref:YcxB family protein n=1 Tax=Corallincola platygyrae TaxID=1193278 RepID=A0ABW4XLT2_9GAMM
MNTAFSYSTKYTLDKSHFSETYDASVMVDDSYRKYSKSVVMAVVGLGLLYFTQVSPYLAWFVVALAGVEALSVRFHKAWWLARQMISKAANNELALTIDEEGVRSKSVYVESQILWSDITQIEKTDQGWLLHLARGKTYISDRCLSDEAMAYVKAKAGELSQEAK